MPHKVSPWGFHHLGAAVSVNELWTIISMGLILWVFQGQVCCVIAMMDCPYLCVYNLFLVQKRKHIYSMSNLCRPRKTELYSCVFVTVGDKIHIKLVPGQ